MAFIKTSVLLSAVTAMLASLNPASAQSSNATYAQVATIQLTFPAADLTPTPIPQSWLDIQGVLNVTFGDTAVSNLGDMLTVAQVQTAPTFRVTSQTAAANSASVFGSDKRFTVAFLDAGVAGKNTSTTVFNHYLGNDFTISSSGRLQNQTAARVAYGAPLPATDDGPHRYMQLVFQQFDNFTAPATPAAGASISELDLPTYYSNANGGLGKIVAANYIQIEVGSGTAPSSTAPVAQASVTALASQKSASGGSGGSSTSAANPTSSGTSGGSNSAASGNLANIGMVCSGALALAAAVML